MGEVSNSSVEVTSAGETRLVPLSTDDIIIPIYPEKGDMLKIKGIGENEVFLGHVQSVDERGHTCQVYFYEKEANCNEAIRE